MNEVFTVNRNNEEYLLIKDYKDHTKYRHSLNKLAQKTYGFDFEEWYRQGYWTDKYMPYSLLNNEEVVANVSVNTIDFLMDGKLRHTLQIGTVMTEEAYRNKGLSRELMNIILKEYEDKYELIYLYANDTVLEFYPKFGFNQAEEYNYSRQFIKRENTYTARKLDIKDAGDMKIITHLVTNTLPTSRISMVGNVGLDMFYLTSFMSDNIYYIEALDLAAVAEFEEGNLTLLDVFCEKEFDLDEVINSLINQEEMKVTLGFTPFNTSLYTCEQMQEAGTTFFVRGQNPVGKGRFPILSHA